MDSFVIIVRFCAWVALKTGQALIAIVALGFSVPSSHLEDRWLGDLITHMKSTGLWWWAGAVASVFLASATLRLTNSQKSKERRILDDLITDALDRFRTSVFVDLPRDEPIDNNRVTLFKYHSCCWIACWRRFFYFFRLRGPTSGWLLMSFRSGHLTKRRMSMFMAPDDGPNSEGVVGQCWRRTGAIRVGKPYKPLPNLSDVSYFSTPYRYYCWITGKNGTCQDAMRRVKQYADQTFISSSWVWRRIKIKACIPTEILAVKVDDLSRKEWGVLVMDSSNNYRCLDTGQEAFDIYFYHLLETLDSYGVFT